MVVPDQVTELSARVKSGEVFLFWDIPDDNEDPIIDYKTEFKLTSSGTFLTFDNGVVPVPSGTVNNLVDGSSYDFRVSAQNNSGFGAVSAVVTVTPIAGKFTQAANLLVILKDHGADVDLSSAQTNLEYEDGVPQSIRITLPASFGEFLIRGAKIQKYDRIYVQGTDARGNILRDVFHVRKMKRSRKGGKGKKLILICPHQSEHLWKRNISLLSRRISGAEAVDQIIEQLNDSDSKGTNDPDVNTNTTFDEVTKKGIKLDKGTSNTYIFEKKKLQEAFDKIIDVEAQPPEGGGSFEPFYIRFKSDYDHDTNTLLDQVSIQAYPQGFVKNTLSGNFENVPNITLKHGITSDPTTNTLENDSDEEPELATNIHLVGAQKSGDFLGDFTKYFGAKQVFLNARTWNISVPFNEGVLVTHEGVVYESIFDNVGVEPPNAFNWIARTFTQPADWATSQVIAKNDLRRNNFIAYKALQAHTSTSNDEPPNPEFWRRVSFVPTTDYSPETRQKAQYWINALGGAKYAADPVKHNQTAMLDPSVIVKDKLHPRTMGRVVGTSPSAIPASHLVNGLIPDAYRILVINPATGAEEGTGIFAPGNLDRNGLEFPGNIADFVDPNLDNTGEWVVFKATATSQDQEVYDHDEGLPWVKFPCEPVFTLGLPDRYVDSAGACKFVVGGGAATRQTVWKQGSYGIFEVPLVGQFAVFYTTGSPIGIKQFECAHSVKFSIPLGRIELGNKGGLSTDDTLSDSAVFVKSSAGDAPSDEQNPFYVGFNFFPGLVPVSSNAIPYGAVTTGEKIATSLMDLDNMIRTADGTINWFGPKSEQYRPLQSIAMWFELIDTFTGSDTLQSDGDYEIGIFLIDRRDNTRILPFTQGKNNDIIPQEGKLPGEFFSAVPGASATFSAKEPEPVDAFDKNNILFGGIYTRDSFDSQGRYKSGSPAAIAAQLIGGKVNRFAFSSELEMAIDGFRRPKALYVTNADEPNALPDRNIDMVDQKKTDLSNYQTAKNLVLGLARLFGFRQQKFEIDFEARFDMAHGDCIYIEDTEEIDETTDSLPNTLKVVVDKIVYKFSKTIDGPAGATGKGSVVTRLWPEEIP